ncbi:MAG TPA: BBP7 family outer membrane beta-barrel protein [Gemmataceae bacterium]|nr:BBP7 family outer membrane beta-barrel protein [Gemmataceae bacterium]
MRQRWLRSLALSLGVVVMGRCVLLGADPSPPVIQPYPPVETPAPRAGQMPASASAGSQEESEPAPAASLDRPIALRDEPRVVDQKIQPTGLFSNNSSTVTAFSPAASYPIARPMPVGPNASTPLPMPAPVLSSPPPPDVPYSWRQPPTSASVPLDSSSSPVIPMPTPVGPSMNSTLSPGIAPAPGVITGPMGSPLVEDGCTGDGCCTPGCCTPGCCDGACCDGTCCDGCCGWGGCCGGNGCCFGNRWFGSAEYLLWFIRGQTLPPLLTGGSIADRVPGALGQPGTTVLFGGTTYDNNPYSGTRLRLGYWFNDCHGLGLDVGGFFLGGKSNSFSATSMGVPFLARPFTNAVTGLPDIEAVAAPTGLAGTFTAVSNFFLYGAEANLRRNLFCGCNWFIDGFAGWRLLGLNESLSMRENLGIFSSTNPNLPTGSTFVVSDRFATSNLFNGGQVGAVGEVRFGRWSVDLRTSIALGGTQQNVNISGSTSSQGPGIVPVTLPGGLLALSSNIGSHTRSMVSMVEEVGVNLGYQFTNHIRGFVGYNFLWWSSVVRPGEQIDTVVNPNLIPPVTPNGGPSRPAFSFHGSDFWVQGITAGLDIRW